MKFLVAAVAAGTLSLGTIAMATPPAEVPADLPVGALGVHAIDQQDWATAEQRLLATPSEVRSDPAVLINLGEVYYRTGRLDRARDAWSRALAAPRHHLVTLRNGRVVSTDVLARTALARFQMASIATK